MPLLPTENLEEKDLQKRLDLDALNFLYFQSLYHKSQSTEKYTAKIFDPSITNQTGTIAYPTAIAPQHLLQQLPFVDYTTIRTAIYAKKAKETALIRKKMLAGLGTTIERKSHVKKWTGQDRAVGAKGTDLFIPIPHPQKNGETATVSFAEAQILQGIYSQERGEFGELFFHDLYSPETENSLATLWESPCLLNPKFSYTEYVKTKSHLKRTAGTKQLAIPTLDSNRKLTCDRMAPGGHALFGLDAILSTLNGTLPSTAFAHLLSSISNGEDLAASPDAYMVGWMAEHGIPIAMIVTEKTPLDRKGGQIALVQDSAKNIYVSIIETAQAKAFQQEELFERIGLTLKTSGQSAFFNTNMALFNHKVLHPILEKMQSQIGEQALIEALTPDLIENWKVQENGKFMQMEGALGSLLLNLDKLSRKLFSTPLVHFIYVPASHRSQFFSPVKTAFDFYLQFYSDRFRLDPERLVPINLNPPTLPEVTLSDPSYADVETVLALFKDASVKELNRLTVSGRHVFEKKILKGELSF